MTALEALRTLRERWFVLVAAAVLAAAATYVSVHLPWVEQRWRSSVLIQATGRLDYGNFLALEKELRPLAEQVRQLPIMREVDANLHTDLSPSSMLDHTRAEPVQDSDQIRLDVDDADPTRAEQLSLAIADVYTQKHNAAEQGKLREERVILSTLARPNDAVLIWPQTRVLVPAAAALGVLVACLVVLGMEYLNDSIRSPADVQRYLELPVLGVVPRPRGAASAAALLGSRPAGSGSTTSVRRPAHRSAEMAEDAPSTAARL